MCRSDAGAVDVAKVMLWHGACLYCQAGFSLWSVPLVVAISELTSLLGLVASLCNQCLKPDMPAKTA
jgi:hypothetical protein